MTMSKCLLWNSKKKKQNKTKQAHITKQTHREQTVGCQRLGGWGMSEIGEGD